MEYRGRYAHDDWDGIVSLLYLLGYREGSTIPHITPIDYYRLRSHRVLHPALFSEVYHPWLLRDGDTLLDHHKPKLGELTFLGDGLTGYLYVHGLGYCVSTSRGRDLSNVAGLSSLLNDRECKGKGAEKVLEGATDPPKIVVEASNVLDNPLIAGPRWLPVVAGYALNRDNVLGVIREHGVLGALEVFRVAGERALPTLKALALDLVNRGVDNRIILAPDRGTALILSLLAQLYAHPKRFGYAYPVEGGYTLVLVSRDRWALEVAERYGGGGRRSIGGYVAGFTVKRLGGLKQWLLPLVRRKTGTDEYRSHTITHS